MKSIAEFDAEAPRTLSYGFLAAALFGEFPLYVRCLPIMRRWLLHRRQIVATWQGVKA